jgi:hypothetical protein
MTPTPKQGLFDLIPPYWATALLVACTWVGVTEMPSPHDMLGFVCFSASLAGVIVTVESMIVKERARVLAILDGCCNSIHASALAAFFRELQVYQALLVMLACGLSRGIAWGMA